MNTEICLANGIEYGLMKEAKIMYFNYALIKNGFIGLQAETLESGTGNVLILNNTRIENMSRWGLFTMFYNVYSTNSVFANCAENTLFLTIGGECDFRHCTFANYWNSSIRQRAFIYIE